MKDAKQSKKEQTNIERSIVTKGRPKKENARKSK